MPQTRQLLGAAGATFTRASPPSALLSVAHDGLTGQYAHNNGVLHNAGRSAASRPSTERTRCRSGCRRRATARHLGKYLNGYGRLRPRAAGLERLAGRAAFARLPDYSSWAVNENGVLRSYPSSPERPGEYQTDFFARRAVELIESAAPGDQPFYLSTWFVAPHRGGPRDPDDPPGFRTPSPAPRRRDLFAGVAMPRPPSFDEANMYDKPQIVADRPRL